MIQLELFNSSNVLWTNCAYDKFLKRVAQAMVMVFHRGLLNVSMYCICYEQDVRSYL